MRVSVNACAGSQRIERDAGSSGASVTSLCEPPDLDTRIYTLVLCLSSKRC